MLFIFKIGNFPHSLSWYTSEYRRIFVKKVGKFASVILVENSAIQAIKLNKICIIDRSNEIQVAEDYPLKLRKERSMGFQEFLCAWINWTLRALITIIVDVEILFLPSKNRSMFPTVINQDNKAKKQRK